MGYKPLKFKFLPKDKTEAMKWHFWSKSHRPSYPEQVFDNLTFKHMDALRKQIQSPVDQSPENITVARSLTGGRLVKQWKFGGRFVKIEI